jgi:hypothetical protein
MTGTRVDHGLARCENNCKLKMTIMTCDLVFNPICRAVRDCSDIENQTPNYPMNRPLGIPLIRSQIHEPSHFPLSHLSSRV